MQAARPPERLLTDRARFWIVHQILKYALPDVKLTILTTAASRLAFEMNRNGEPSRYLLYLPPKCKARPGLMAYGRPDDEARNPPAASGAIRIA